MAAFFAENSKFPKIIKIPEPLDLEYSFQNAVEFANSEEGLLSSSSIELPRTLKNACLKRKTDYIRGRQCAFTAFRKMGIEATGKLLPDERRIPTWPKNCLGSITHSKNITWAIVSSKANYHGLGIDCEFYLTAERTAKLMSSICAPSEILLGKKLNLDKNIFLTLIFSVKESIFKCLYPQTHVFFGFKDAEITKIDLKNSCFSYLLKKRLDEKYPTNFTSNGSFYLGDEYILSLVSIMNSKP